jgi:hypothetical protein
MDQTWGDKMAESRAKRKQTKDRPVFDGVREYNDWNPFERVDPAVIEDIHKRHDHNKIVHTLEDTEEEENGQTL